MSNKKIPIYNVKESRLDDFLDDISLLNDLTILYLRLSREDDLKGESNSIKNQKAVLTDYSKRNKFKNMIIIIDDGITGTTLNRPGFNVVRDLIEQNKVKTLIVKDMSRLGRNYIEVGRFTEEFLPLYNVRLIAVNESVDTLQGEDDFVPFRNIMNEWYAKDMSRKMRAAMKLKDEQGYAIGRPPLGYRHNEEDKKRWVIDEEGGAEIVRNIYKMRLNGHSVVDIAKTLTRKKVLIPSQYAMEKDIRKTSCIKEGPYKYLWTNGLVRNILTNQSYVGDILNFKTYRKSYKLKTKYDNERENWKIHRDVHEPIIERNMWESIQKTFGKTKMKKSKYIDNNIFAGLLKCSDCGANLNYKHTNDNPDNHYYSCYNNRAGNGICKRTHHIRVDDLTKLVKNNISEILKIAKNYEDEFVKIVVNENYRRIQQKQKKNEVDLEKMLSRDNEIDRLIESLYEEKVLKNLTEERFLKLTDKYEEEQLELKQRIKNMKKIVLQEKNSEMNSDGFLKIVKKYSEIEELTAEIVREFINKIIVYHREEIGGERVQNVEIYYNMIGYINLPTIRKCDEESLKKVFGRKENEKIA